MVDIINIEPQIIDQLLGSKYYYNLNYDSLLDYIKNIAPSEIDKLPNYANENIWYLFTEKVQYDHF